jgi:transposase
VPCPAVLADRTPASTAAGHGQSRRHLDNEVDSTVFIEFCKRLLNDANNPVYLVVDGHPCHRSKATVEFVTSTQGRLRLFLLPGYSPQLNPYEWVWKNVNCATRR